MPSTTYLVTVSGPDRQGVGAQLFEALSAVPNGGCVMNDVAQITIRDTLVLCVEVSVASSISPDELARIVREHGVATAGIDVSVTVVEPLVKFPVTVPSS